jgi:16S rRNA processing protein RimM
MDRLAIGKVLKSHGLKGFINVHSFSGDFNHFHRLREVYLLKTGVPVLYRIEALRAHSDMILLKLQGVDTPEKAKELSGCTIWVEREYASPLSDGEYYVGDLCSCSIHRNDRDVGRVKSVIDSGAGDLLEVVFHDGKVLMIPLMEHYIDEVDIKDRKIYLKEDVIDL